MNTYQKKLMQHCNEILGNPNIRQRIVVLCEGQGSILNLSDETTVNYGKMKQMPDADFYIKCIPKTWKTYKPEFFNCQGRTGVIDTYFKLLELHEEGSRESYLNPDKLFAIVDLDLQSQNIDNYGFSNTEEIFSNLYQQGQVNEENTRNHRIWVTGLIHKEAYFIIPELQEVFDNHINVPMYNSQKLILEDIYITMADAIINSNDLNNNLSTVSNRISHCSGLDCTDLEKLRNSWKEQFENSPDKARKNDLIYALLMLKKVKDKTTKEKYWEDIKPPIDWTNTEEVFRDKLLGEIAKFYSEQSNCAKYHIPAFIQFLKHFSTLN
ncbi:MULTISPECIES: hypothetical protein [unclassified Dolichospermum]|uniref:hypothetical protein n=1 Tax=unclassified Dolichospermum TaxID=2622029 RepID=UPI001444B448|nr:MULTISPECIES: hypothetical protein [unclassified Dolichospermum]MTJ15580.1 hypothetical protein [Dolichospermum sp. UHCC 0299]MTJ39064.1 hypothetical protein [Dolichospermum sp. UHCC 0406]